MNHRQNAVLQFLPAIRAIQGYSFEFFRRDLFAGCTVAAVAVPQAMAYASIIGLPVQYGLYTAIVMTAVGALFDSSRHLVNGPTNIISIATASALSIALVPAESMVSAAIMLALMIGLIQLSISLLRLGDFSRFISHAVIVGFTAGASVILILDQLTKALGLKAQGNLHDHFLKRFYLTITQGGPIQWPTVYVTLGTIGIILFFRWINRLLKIRLPDFLLGIIVAALAVIMFKGADQGVLMVEAVPQTLPSFQRPMVDFALARDLASSAAAIAFLGLLEAIAMAKSLASKSGQRLDMNQQCLSESVANIAGSFFQCFPGSGSLTRSYINHQANAATQWAAIFSAIIVALTIPFFAQYASYIPKAALAGVLLLTATRMIDYRSMLYHFRATRFDAIIVVVTALSAVFISIEFCVLIGVVLSFFMYVPRAAKLYVSELTVGTDRIVRELRPEDKRCGLYRIYNFEGELFFGSSTELENNFDEIESNLTSEIRVILIRLKRARNPDAVCLHLFDQFIDKMHRRAIIVILSGVHDGMSQSLTNVGIVEKLGKERVFLESSEIWSSTIDAVRYIYTLLGPARCEICSQKNVSPADGEDFYYMI
jgi:sulfate permease, SulP family